MRSLATYAVILATSALLVLNPLIVYYLSGSRSLSGFALLLDAWLVTIILFGAHHLRRRGRSSFWLMIGAIGTLVPALLVGEIGFTYLRLRHGDHLLGQVPAIFREDAKLIYALIPGTRDRHVSLGNFDVEYVIDDQGRKLVPQNEAARRAVHVFGDSFTFGFGASNQDTWPNLLSRRLGDEINVLNYGVVGYSIEQMYLALEAYVDEIQPGDLIVFAPISADLERSLAGRLYVCGGRVRAEANEVFPMLEDGLWVYASLAEACNLVLDSILANSPLPIGFGSLYRYYHNRTIHPDLIANAEAIFAQAERLAGERGAHFGVVFLATPGECARGRLNVDLGRLAARHRSLLPDCSAQPEAAAGLRFLHDGHFNPLGHAWTAAAVHRALAGLPALGQDELATAIRRNVPAGSD